jgi:hypothetical protein
MKNAIKKLFGIDKIEAAKKQAEEELKVAQEAADAAKEVNRLQGLSPKDLATEKKEPWVGCLDVQVNSENVRNGFFELDWNEYFIQELRRAGYTGQADEEVVAAWFSDVAKNSADQEGIDMTRRATGYINTNNLGGGRTEVS